VEAAGAAALAQIRVRLLLQLVPAQVLSKMKVCKNYHNLDLAHFW
jgi:hypothetical protein